MPNLEDLTVDVVVNPVIDEQGSNPDQPTMTKGEAIVTGLAMIEDGLKMIAGLGNKYDLVRAVVGSNQAATKLRSTIADNKIMYNLVLNIVRARNASNLSAKSVDRVVDDLLDTLFDLSRPYQASWGGAQDAPMAHLRS